MTAVEPRDDTAPVVEYTGERRRTTIVAVLHDLALAAHFFGRVVVMSDGRIVADGPPASTLDEARIREVFGVDPALVRLPAGRPNGH